MCRQSGRACPTVSMKEFIKPAEALCCLTQNKCATNFRLGEKHLQIFFYICFRTLPKATQLQVVNTMFKVRGKIIKTEEHNALETQKYLHETTLYILYNYIRETH
jgi:hypothetical protein